MESFNGGVSRVGSKQRTNLRNSEKIIEETPEEFEEQFYYLFLYICQSYSTSIPQLWELDGFMFIKICCIVIKGLSNSSGPQASASSLESIARFMESK